MDDYPGVIGIIIGLLVFLGIWIYAFSQWGFLIGLMFGWIPSMIGAIIAAYVWPLFVLIIGVIIIAGLFF
jgi:hypothetical protein